MSFLQDSVKPDSESNFDFYKELFGDEVSAEPSETTIKPDPETVKGSSVEFSFKSQRETSLDSRLYRRSRTSSIKRSLLIVQSVRSRLSSIKSEFESEFSVREQPKKIIPPEVRHHVEAQHKEMLESFSKTMERTREKLLKIGSQIIDKSRSKQSTSMEPILAKMEGVRDNLSKKRRKLIVSFCKLDQLSNYNAELDQRIQNIRIEDLHDLQVEINRTGEKIDETRKQMAKARSRYESDLCMASHIREKWYVFQNKILGQLEDKYEMDRDIRENRVYMCGLLKRKQQLRKERLQLKKECRLIDNEALLRKYDDAVESIAAIRSYTKKFNEL